VCGWCQQVQREMDPFSEFFVGWIDTANNVVNV
jgi:hypothetical protein